MKIRKKAAIIALAAVFACGTLAGCDLVTTDASKDMKQVIAEVDISKTEYFQEGGEFAAYANDIQPATILKRDLVANFLSVGASYVQQGSSYKDVFESLQKGLVNRKMILQYAIVEFFESDDPEYKYSAEGYRTAISGEFKSESEKKLAGYGYFLTDEEKARAEYSLKVTFNNTLDSQEKSILKTDESKTTTSTSTTGNSDTRAVPKGVDTVDDDYYDESYKVYTGKNHAADCGSYETVEGSTPATRVKAYNTFLSSLLSNDLLSKGEDVTDIEQLEYYTYERVEAYEDAIISKLSRYYEKQAEKSMTEEYVTGVYTSTLETQKSMYRDKSSYESAIGSLSDTQFVLTAPETSEQTKYGFVINILLPFSKTQSNMLTEYSKTHTETENYIYRASLLKALQATDQRETWFTGDTDYSFKDSSGAYRFFENSVTAGKDGKYEPLKNYVGNFAYQGKVEYDEKEKTYTLTPDKIDIDGFLGKMEGYLKSEGLTASGEYQNGGKESYYSQVTFDGSNGIDYSYFLYYQGKVEIDDAASDNVFVANTDMNKAMSVVNELSFAYNTDTGGLNSYLGYAVNAYDTSYVSEFEYAAKKAVLGGVGTYTVCPSTYGWHIMYCTFVCDTDENGAVYKFNYKDAKDKEGSFSNLYYEALKSSMVSQSSSEKQKKITTKFSDSVTLYEDRYSDLLNLDSAK